MIPVTKPFLPPRAEYQKYIDQIWDRNWLTNNGPLVRELEAKLEAHLGVDRLLFVSNGTTALQLAIQALDLRGEIITTPFTYVATTSSIVWEGCTPVYVDVDPNTFNIDPSKIEAAITPQTTAILATHVFGNPCDIDSIQSIAERYDLQVIYDASHCFGVKYKGQSVLRYGDVSTISFHATKLFHTVEGGGIVSSDAEVQKRVALSRNFGHVDFAQFEGVGINGKNSEFHAAMGLSNLPFVPQLLKRRKEIYLQYKALLEGDGLGYQQYNVDAQVNHSYFAVLFDSLKDCLKVKAALEMAHIYPRRYFYPTMNAFDYVRQVDMPIAQDIAERVLCLPVFHAIEDKEIAWVCAVIRQSLHASKAAKKPARVKVKKRAS